MSSISPESSASQRAVEVESIVLPFDFAGFAEALKVAQSSGSSSVDELANRLIGTYHAYLRVHGGQTGSSIGNSVSATSVGSGSISSADSASISSGGVSVTLKGAAAARYHAIRSKMTWRPGSPEGGYCYLKAIRKYQRDSVMHQLGPWPTINSILALPRSRFRQEEKLRKLKLHGDPTKVHLVEDGKGVSLFNVMVDIASRCPLGVPSDAVYHRMRVLEPKVSSGFSGTTLVGGLTVRSWLEDRIGRDIGECGGDAELVSLSAALLPAEDKHRLRLLEVVGDSALTLRLSEIHLELKRTVQGFQEARSKYTSNKFLAEKFVTKVPPGVVLFAGGVDPATGTAGAKALEAIIGLVWRNCTVVEFDSFIEQLFGGLS